MAISARGEEFRWQFRSQQESSPGSGQFVIQTKEAVWPAKQTAFIVCDVWDAHHCLNAVRRLEEFAPRMNKVLKTARERGATIIHAPSDCMPAYADHPARKRAMAAPVAKNQPAEIKHWCSRIPSEAHAEYPIDQSDGGEDDDPAEHAQWAAKLKAMGRNPGTPWKTQSPLIEIDGERDYISDRGDEVWNVLEARGIENVVLVGVHLNMCVLGRPFGLRQMVRHGKQAALMSDMTDCMYNPKRFPKVDHFTGNDLMISYVARHICPIITSNQLLGGEPFRSKFDARDGSPIETTARSPRSDWTPLDLPSPWAKSALGARQHAGPTWYRCVVRLPKAWADANSLTLEVATDEPTQVWLNGSKAMVKSGQKVDPPRYDFPGDALVADDYHLLVVRVEHRSGEQGLAKPPVLQHGTQRLELRGRWQFRIGDDAAWNNIPLPAKFGGAPDMSFEPTQ
jgi:nicotinamidase-related amidase